MTKFGSEHPQLEVCGTAAWIPAYLNRHVITMMDYNGLPPEVSRVHGSGVQSGVDLQAVGAVKQHDCVKQDM
jgi:hypothetical protein